MFPAPGRGGNGRVRPPAGTGSGGEVVPSTTIAGGRPNGQVMVEWKSAAIEVMAANRSSSLTMSRLSRAAIIKRSSVFDRRIVRSWMTGAERRER
jgi:hypothetical protein